MPVKAASAPDAGAPARFQVNLLGDTIAAEVIGLDLTRPFDAATLKAVKDAFLRYRILCFRDQNLTKPQQVAFSEQFGELERHTLRNKGQDLPLVHMVTNLGPDGKPTGVVKSQLWHSDKSFRPAPCMATILHAVELPPVGGETYFADMYSAYDALSADAKAEVDDLRVVHSWALSRENTGRVMSQEEIDDAPPMAHPLARVHPETGKRALFMGCHASHLEGWDFAAGRARIEALEAHATQPQFLYAHAWRKGDVLMWDNRCLLHRANASFDAAKHPRVLPRTCVRGTPTG
ncbi:MAG: TauD/TfdA dioxygenase family protein [Hyphomicrobiaceae bacterium]